MYDYNNEVTGKIATGRKSMKKVILASSSPRREELLRQLSLEFEIIPSGAEEILNENITPYELVKELSLLKAMEVTERIREKAGYENSIVIGADTIVLKDKVLGKPTNKEDAFNMLKSLQGTFHEVMTGVTIVDVFSGKFLNEVEVTKVYMNPLEDREIYAYIDKGESFDKAGAYGIQSLGSILVSRIEGCYFNVVGLPLPKLNKMLKEFDINLLN